MYYISSVERDRRTKVYNDYRSREEQKLYKMDRSKIDGRGMFTTVDLSEGSIIGIAYVEQLDFREIPLTFRWKDGAVTILGLFINHSLTPNCDLILRNGIYRLFALRDIEAGEELTYNYKNWQIQGALDEWK